MIGFGDVAIGFSGLKNGLKKQKRDITDKKEAKRTLTGIVVLLPRHRSQVSHRSQVRVRPALTTLCDKVVSAGLTPLPSFLPKRSDLCEFAAVFLTAMGMYVRIEGVSRDQNSYQSGEKMTLLLPKGHA